jgi:hypothetical protein
MFDPTAAVAPERVQKGIEQSLSATDRQFLAKPFGSSIKMLLLVREQWEAINFKWTLWVMNYDTGSQAQLLERLLGDVSPTRIAILVIISGSGFGFLLFTFLLLGSRKRDLPDTSLVYLQLCKKLKAAGFIPYVNETPRTFANRVIVSKPELAISLSNLIDLYEQWAYGENAQLEVQLRAELRKFKP